ncbi:hypothetical protein ACFOMD_15805 [Sphingoaurantiacus capsulatus]|uniref:Uncharacterized protein n=1 Tax=Sphingoaurantiacus capsulatus TaxID=1771310 RepID=A0ABV7XGI7_9SPHN
MRYLMPAALLALAAAAPAPIKADKAASMLMDGHCTDAAWTRAKGHDIGHGANLKIAADADFVWLCVTPPAESYATADLYLVDKAGAIHNLHASAQLGERVKGASGWPDYVWGNNVGWYGNPVAFSGAREGRVQFTPSKGRELQIARSKYPGDRWTLMLEVRALGAANTETVFPAGAKEDDTKTWVTVQL